MRANIIVRVQSNIIYMSIINYRRFDHKIQSSYLLQLVIFNIYFATVQYDIQKKDYPNFYINFNKITEL